MSEVRAAIEELLRQGLSLNAIARQLGLANSTVQYHADRSRSQTADKESARRQAVFPAVRTQVRSRAQVAELLAAGVTRAEIARRLGLSKATVSYHARRLGHAVDERCARRYDWTAVQAFYDDGHSVRECREAFGFSLQTWHAAVQRGAVSARPAALPLDQLLVAGQYRGRHNIKVRLLKEGLKAARCEGCGLTEWRGEPISFALHHVNGDRHDNRLVNLELLCPNCHSQTDTFSGRNRRRLVSEGPR